MYTTLSNNNGPLQALSLKDLHKARALIVRSEKEKYVTGIKVNKRVLKKIQSLSITREGNIFSELNGLKVILKPYIKHIYQIFNDGTEKKLY